ncbi:hypothetical protein EVC45_37055 [Paraburkholderia sp. UYCP14C]|uniref:hypothetical protein n=1 Tax=Paraburkholderia sp. UYCP14C TaxID=2511130 RepID=UPI001021C083|nr:hypothetical protein [Paraburkholderia sp. UYCP14C]RZF24755.1 hypothetical protein EVC45_37055 [Paraburkholderia sp. UYCP14C]
MQTCPLRRASIDARTTKSATRQIRRRAPTPPTKSGSRAERWLRVGMTLSSLIGWRALADLLAAIPDSNDDFSVF